MTPNPTAPNGQGELFPDPRGPLPPANWSSTSKAAAHAIREHAPTMRERVFDFIAGRPDGATIEEIADGLDMRQSSVCGRIAELARPAIGPARITDSGQRRLTTARVEAKVWVANEASR